MNKPKSHWATQEEIASEIKFKMQDGTLFKLLVGVQTIGKDEYQSRWKWYRARGEEARKIRSKLETETLGV